MNLSFKDKFIYFFQRQNLYNKDIFDYFRNNSIIFNYLDKDYHPFIGCFYTTKNKKVNKINLIVPYIDSEITTLINIHEYTHAIILYEYINKIFPDEITTEVLPIFYERLYIEENKNNGILQNHINIINKRIITSSNPEVIKYKIALNMQNNLLEYYYGGHKDINELDTRVKELIKRQNCNL